MLHLCQSHDRDSGVTLSPFHDGHCTIGLHRLRRDGVEPIGRLTAAKGEKMRFADDLRHNMENADGFSLTARRPARRSSRQAGRTALPRSALHQLGGEIADALTFGMDQSVGAGRSLAEGGAGIVTISSGSPGSMNVAPRIVVMSGGRVREEIPLPAFDERRILDATFSAHIRQREHREANRGWPEIPDRDS